MVQEQAEEEEEMAEEVFSSEGSRGSSDRGGEGAVVVCNERAV